MSAALDAGVREAQNLGRVVAVRGSVVDVRFETRLPPIHTVLRAGADENIDEVLTTLRSRSQHLRQSSIDEELFDVISGFEALENPGR